MKYLIIIILISSCSVIRKVNKSDVKTETRETAKAQEKTDSEKESTIKTVTTEKAQGSVNIPESNLSGTGSIDSVTVIEDDKQKIVITPTGKGKFKAEAKKKAESIPVNIDRTVVKDEQIKEKIRKDSTGSETKKDRSESSEFGKDVKKTGLIIPWWVYVLLFASIAGGVYWKWFRKGV